MRTLVILLAVFIVSCEDMTTGLVFIEPGTFTDARDGKVYKTVSIAGLTWMAENLAYINYDYYPDTIDFPTLRENPVVPLYFDNEEFGVLYNWYAAIEAAPEGWHLPTELEWSELIKFVGGVDVAGENLKDKDKFNAQAGGIKSDEFFNTRGRIGGWWGEGFNGEQWGYKIYFTGNKQYIVIEDQLSLKAFAKYLSIRCVKDY